MQRLGRVSATSVPNVQASEGCDRHHNQIQKNSAGEDSAIYSVRGHHSGCFGLRETIELYQPQSWATIAE